jgi:hypothetical protein
MILEHSSNPGDSGLSIRASSIGRPTSAIQSLTYLDAASQRASAQTTAPFSLLSKKNIMRAR